MHDNACPNVARVVQGYTKEAGIKVMSQPEGGTDTDTTGDTSGTHGGMRGYASAKCSQVDTQHGPGYLEA